MVLSTILEKYQMDKNILDGILKKYKAQPLGYGYIDIIVTRDNYKDFISDLVTIGYKIVSVSWWAWCEDKSRNAYELGGPIIVFSKGWFSEIPMDVDDFSFSADAAKERIIKEVINKIETKTISFSDQTVCFKESNWLTPAIWLDVPHNWRNKYST